MRPSVAYYALIDLDFFCDSLAVRDLSNLVKPEDMVASEHLVTLLAIVPKYSQKDWLGSYESLDTFVVMLPFVLCFIYGAFQPVLEPPKLVHFSSKSHLEKQLNVFYSTIMRILLSLKSCQAALNCIPYFIPFIHILYLAALSF
jgi:hypothetical protein